MSTSVMTPQETNRLHRWAMWRMTVNEGIISCIKDGETARVFYPDKATPSASDARRSVTPTSSSAAGAAGQSDASELMSDFPFISAEQMSLARKLNLREKYGSSQGLSDDSYFIFGIPRINVCKDIPEVTSTGARGSVYGSFSDFTLEELNNNLNNTSNNNNKNSGYYSRRPGNGEEPGNTTLNFTLSEFGPSLDMQSLASHDMEVQKINGYGREEWKAPTPVSPVPRLNLYSIEEELNSHNNQTSSSARLYSSDRFRSIPSPPYGGHATRVATMTDRSVGRFHNASSSSYYTAGETTDRSQVSDRGLRGKSSAFVRSFSTGRSESASDPYLPSGRYHERRESDLSPAYDNNARATATLERSPTGLFHDSSSLFINTVPKDTATDPYLLNRSNSTTAVSPSWKATGAAEEAARYNNPSDRFSRQDSSSLFDKIVPRDVTATADAYLPNRSNKATPTDSSSPPWKPAGVDRYDSSGGFRHRDSSVFSFENIKPEGNVHRFQNGSAHAHPSSNPFSYAHAEEAEGEAVGDRRFSASGGGPRHSNYARPTSFPYGSNATETNERYPPANHLSMVRGVPAPSPLKIPLSRERVRRSSSVADIRPTADPVSPASHARGGPEIYPPFSPSRYAASQGSRSHGYNSPATLPPPRMHSDSPSLPASAGLVVAVTRPQSYSPLPTSAVSPSPSSVTGYDGRNRPTNSLGNGIAESVKRQAYYDWATPTADKKVLDWPQVGY